MRFLSDYLKVNYAEGSDSRNVGFRVKSSKLSDDGQFIEVLEGLKEGEVVVTSGMEGLKDGMRATVKVQGGGTK